MPKKRIDVWNFDETIPILEILLYKSPRPVKRETIRDYINGKLANMIYPALLTRRLNRLVDEGLINKDKSGYYSIKEKRCSPIIQNLILKKLNSFNSKQVIPVSVYDGKMVLYGLNPNFSDANTNAKIDDLKDKLENCLLDLYHIKKQQIDNFIMHFVSKQEPELKEFLTAPEHNRLEALKEKAYEVYFTDDNLALLDLDSLWEINNEPSEKKKDKIINFLDEFHERLLMHFPCDEHGFIAIQPDGYEVWEYGGRIQRAEHPAAKILLNAILTTKRGRYDTLIDNLIKDGSPKKSISEEMEQLQKVMVEMCAEDGLENMAFDNMKKRLLDLQQLIRTIECPKCYRPISPKNIISTEYPDGKYKHLTDKIYVYNCDCGCKIQKTFREIDIKKVEKEMKMRKKKV
ncbi:MAG: hypothetical protein PHU95_01915 [Candidatus Thermoplasmatota archaeon]|nr:hypothetical protein [Candidatus Thermoplasmatota archaeon]MDD5778187.1 hypothetical protein [Candidatus Thermoplasmatota archaeon]